MTLPVPVSHLHRRYQVQARWTAAIRQRLFSRAGLVEAQRILEVGAGTGAVLAETARAISGRAYGVDIEFTPTAFARREDSLSRYLVGDGARLPLPPATFDLTFCHFLILWLPDPAAVIREMARVTRPGGAVLCLAEPDYGGRIEYPEALAEMAQAQTEALAAQGASPRAGRRLPGLLRDAGLSEVQAGVLGGEWPAVGQAMDEESEWDTLARDLQGRPGAASLAGWRRIDSEARRAGTRIQYVPTFYAWGRVPADR